MEEYLIKEVLGFFSKFYTLVLKLKSKPPNFFCKILSRGERIAAQNYIRLEMFTKDVHSI